jgi:hypothetical protein
MMFCQARQHMLLQPDAELWIMPVAGGFQRVKDFFSGWSF